MLASEQYKSQVDLLRGWLCRWWAERTVVGGQNAVSGSKTGGKGSKMGNWWMKQLAGEDGQRWVQNAMSFILRSHPLGPLLRRPRDDALYAVDSVGRN